MFGCHAQGADGEWPSEIDEGEPQVKKLMSILLGLSLVIGTASVAFSADPPAEQKTEKKKKSKKSKKEGEKQEEKKS